MSSTPAESTITMPGETRPIAVTMPRMANVYAVGNTASVFTKLPEQAFCDFSADPELSEWDGKGLLGVGCLGVESRCHHARANGCSAHPPHWICLASHSARSCAEPIVLSVPAVDKNRYYSVMLNDGNTLQLRLHWQPRHRQRAWCLPHCRTALARRDAAGDQEGIPVDHRLLPCCLPHPALQPGRHGQRD